MTRPDVAASLVIAGLCCLLTATCRPRRRARGVPITVRAIQIRDALLSRTSAGGRGVSTGRHRIPRGIDPRPPVRAESTPAPASTAPAGNNPAGPPPAPRPTWADCPACLAVTTVRRAPASCLACSSTGPTAAGPARPDADPPRTGGPA